MSAKKEEKSSPIPEAEGSHDQNAPNVKDEREHRARVVGGKYVKELHEDESNSSDDGDKNGQLVKVDDDIPLTLTKLTKVDGEEIILLEFAEGDKENPFNWPASTKRLISVILCLMTLFIGLATTAYSSGIESMAQDLNTSIENAQLGLFLFNEACAIAPLFLAPFCELVGRKVIYSGSYLVFSLIFIGLALGQNIATILVMRTLLGLAGCVGTILVGGTFSDMYEPHEIARPMAFFSYCAILGTVAAPIYSGFIDVTIGWRWIEGIQGLSNIPLLIIVFVFLKETRGGVTLQKRAKALRKSTGDERYRSPMDVETRDLKDMLHKSSVKAIHMLVTEPVVFAFGLWIGFAWFITFLFLSVIPITFSTKRGWAQGVSGLPYISLVVGVTIGYFANFLQMRKYYSIVESDKKKVLPEHRLYGAMFGAAFLPLGLFIYSFTQYGFLPWVAPTIALAPIAIGIFFIFESTYSVTSDCYGENSSSAIAAQGLMRNTLGGVAPLFATAFFVNVGSQYAGLILALCATLLTFIPFIMFKYGHKLRERSKMAQKF